MAAVRLPYQEAARNLLRDTVLDAVDELVRGKGWVGTSLAHVAKVAGVSRQTVYNEFGSRQSVGQAYIERRLEKLLESIATALRANKDDLTLGIREAVELYFDMVDEPLLQTVLAPGELGPELIELVKSINNQATGPIAALLREIRPDVSEGDAVIFADAMAQLATAYAVVPTSPREVAIERIVRLSEVVLNGR